MAPLIMAGLSLLPKIPKMWGAIAGLFGKKAPKSIQDAGELASIIMDDLTKDKIPPEIRVKLEEIVMSHEKEMAEIALKEVALQRDVVVAEITGDSWLQRNWRPMLMCLFGVIIANNYVFNPWLKVMFEIDIIMTIPPQMWSLLKLGVGGYIVGRSTEKAVKEWKKK